MEWANFYMMFDTEGARTLHYTQYWVFMHMPEGYVSVIAYEHSEFPKTKMKIIDIDKFPAWLVDMINQKHIRISANWLEALENLGIVTQPTFRLKE